MLEEFALILGTAASTIGTLACIGYFTQAIKIFKRKSSADISLVTYLTFFITGFTWLLYGISSNNLYLIIPNIFALIGVVSVLAAYHIHKK
jgi:uncharacterized protein with PQ loop repeat